MSKDGIVYALFKTAVSYNGSDVYNSLCSIHNSNTAAFETAVNMLKTAVSGIIIENHEQIGTNDEGNILPEDQKVIKRLIDCYNKISKVSDLIELTELIGDDEFQTSLRCYGESYQDLLHYFGYADDPVFMQFSVQEMVFEQTEGVSLDSILEAEKLIKTFQKGNK